MNLLDELARRIRRRSEFHNDLQQLRRASLQRALGLPESLGLDDDAVARLLQCATVFASTSDADTRNLGYEIATSAAPLQNDERISSLVAFVLSTLGNFVALKPLGTPLEEAVFIPSTAFVRSLFHQGSNTLSVPGGGYVILTDLQLQIWNELREGRSVSITAPTSAGKSFILLVYVVQRLLEAERQRFRVIYLVPTRALITQSAVAVTEALERAGVSDVSLLTTPIERGDELPDRVIAIWTQERLQVSLAAHEGLAADLLVVDEAQVIGEGGRGVILSNVVDALLMRNDATQVFFASPFIENPDVLGKSFGLRAFDTIRAEDLSVGQNIIIVSTKGRSVVLEGYTDGSRVELGSLQLPRSLSTQEDRLTVIPPLLAQNSQSLIYARGAAEAESITEVIAKDSPAPSEAASGRTALSDLAAEVVHPKYALVSSVVYGVGFHYGRMPAIVRKAVEESFSSGVLQYLVTTSTLLHGVNLPARNIFLHKPSRGKGKGISGVDFWNLAGRAGRLGKELQGNVFLIDYDSWPEKPLDKAKQQAVRPSLTEILTERAEEFLKYITTADQLPPERDDFDNAFVRLFADLISDRIAQTFLRAGLAIDSIVANRIVSALKNAQSRSGLDPSIIALSPTVSVYRQQNLYAALCRGIKSVGPRRFILSHPRNADAFDRLADAMKMVHTHILDYPAKDRRHRYFAYQALLWMRGAGIPLLVDRQLTYKREHGESPLIGTAIRETLDMIENSLRYQYVRLLACYINVLTACLEHLGYAEFVSSIASIPLYLEVGASERTTISLISLGLSRVSAMKLTESTARMDLTRSAALRWLKALDLRSLQLSPFLSREIEQIRHAL
jgi:DEAD/DEAH box helicase